MRQGAIIRSAPRNPGDPHATGGTFNLQGSNDGFASSAFYWTA